VPKGLNRPLAAPAAKIAGSTGKMQGESAVKIPAKNENPNKINIVTDSLLFLSLYHSRFFSVGQISEYGFMAIFEDSEGNHVALHSLK